MARACNTYSLVRIYLMANDEKVPLSVPQMRPQIIRVIRIQVGRGMNGNSRMRSGHGSYKSTDEGRIAWFIVERMIEYKGFCTFHISNWRAR